MFHIHTVRRVDEQQISHAGDRTACHVVLRDAHFLHHVEAPHDVGFFFHVVGFARFFDELFFVGDFAVVFTIVKTFGIETSDLASTGDVIQSVPFHVGATANTLQRPIMHAARGKLFATMLPEEFAVFIVKRQQAA